MIAATAQLLQLVGGLSRKSTRRRKRRKKEELVEVKEKERSISAGEWSFITFPFFPLKDQRFYHVSCFPYAKLWPF